MEQLCLQGRTLAPEQLVWIRDTLATHPQWGRYRLSRYIAETWNWRNGVGQLKDMAARTLLLKLERRGLLELPPRKTGAGNRKAMAPPAAQQLEFIGPEIINASLRALQPLQILRAETGGPHQLLRQLLQQHHYLGYRRPVGENLQYLVLDPQQRPLACLVFGAAAWKCAPRDQFIGWDPSTREKHLPLIANNMRFLILPWVEIKYLASHLLGRIARQLSPAWQGKYGHPIYLLESFVEEDRFEGTCYRAANWVCLGRTQGRSRNDRTRCLQVPAKAVYVYGLHRQFRSLLGGSQP